MIEDYLLTLILFTPVVAGLIILLIPEDRVPLIRWFALLASLVPLALAITMWRAYDPGQPGFQFQVQLDWYPAVGASFHLGVDGISVVLVLLATLLTPISILISWNINDRIKTYMALFLMLETGMLGVFLTLDLMLFFLFW